MNKRLGDTEVVSVSFFVSILDIVVNIVFAITTGSAVMIAQTFQGLSDLITAGLVFYGVRRSKRKWDESHNFGYGRELYFWIIISAFFMFFGTGMLSIYFGYRQFVNPVHIGSSRTLIIVLTVLFFMNAYAFWLALQRLLKRGNQNISWWSRIIYSSLVETKTTLILDCLGTAGPLIGIVAIGLFALTGDASFDGLGGIVIGIFMMIGALALIWDVKNYIVGRSLPRASVSLLKKEVTALTGVNSVLDLRTMYIGSAQLLIIIEVHLYDALTTDEIEKLSDKIKLVTKKVIPQTKIVQVEVETPDEELG
jgi:cation diffusion facilitator family transporter